MFLKYGCRKPSQKYVLYCFEGVMWLILIISNYRGTVGSFLWIIDTRHKPCQPHSPPQFPHLPCRDRQGRDYIISCLNLLCFKAWDLLARPFCCRAEPAEKHFQALIYQASVDIPLFLQIKAAISVWRQTFHVGSVLIPSISDEKESVALGNNGGRRSIIHLPPQTQCVETLHLPH